MANIEMPQLGETVTEGTITKWFKAVGETVAEDEVLFEVSTDKVDSEVPSPVAGVLTEIRVSEGDTVDVGVVLAVIDGEAAGGVSTPAAPVSEPAPTPTGPPVVAPPPTAVEGDPRVLSPLVRRLIAEHGLDLDDIVGTGVGGRVTRADVERRIQASRATPAEPEPAGIAVSTAPRHGDRETIVPLTNIRRRTGEHMVQSKVTSPHAMTAVEVDYENVERIRRLHREPFKHEEGFSLTYLPFISRAVIDALEEFPHLNATVDGGDLIVHNYVNLSIAVDLDFEGLLAPVVRDADQKRLRAIAREVRDLAVRARSKKLSADDITGGTFTLTNAGSYGTHMVIPVINQPQVAILSTDGVQRKPVVVTDDQGAEAVAIHSVGLLAMSWDHRAFDGAYAAAFLARVREIIETRAWDAEL